MFKEVLIPVKSSQRYNKFSTGNLLKYLCQQLICKCTQTGTMGSDTSVYRVPTMVFDTLVNIPISSSL